MSRLFEEEWVVVLADQLTGEKRLVREDLTKDVATEEVQRLNMENRREFCYYYAKDYISFTGRVKPNKDGKPWYTHRDWSPD